MHNVTRDKGHARIQSQIATRGIGLTIDPWTHRPVQAAVPYRPQDWVPQSVRGIGAVHAEVRHVAHRRARASTRAKRFLWRRGIRPAGGAPRQDKESCYSDCWIDWYGGLHSAQSMRACLDVCGAIR